MALMKKRILLLLAAVLFWGCYDFESGSRVDLFNLTGEDGDEEDADIMWRSCDRGDDSYFDLKSGDTCNFQDGCSYNYDDQLLESRTVDCDNGLLTVTEIVGIEEPAPDVNAYWRDCETIEDARNGEVCEGRFLCFGEREDNCLDIVGCTPSRVESVTSIERYHLCDDATLSVPSTNKIHTDCETVWDARPADTCTGSFLCGMNHTLQNNAVVGAPPETIPLIEGQGWFGPSEWEDERMVWCYDDRITIFKLWQII